MQTTYPGEPFPRFAGLRFHTLDAKTRKRIRRWSEKPLRDLGCDRGVARRISQAERALQREKARQEQRRLRRQLNDLAEKKARAKRVTAALRDGESYDAQVKKLHNERADAVLRNLLQGPEYAAFLHWAKDAVEGGVETWDPRAVPNLVATFRARMRRYALGS